MILAGAQTKRFKQKQVTRKGERFIDMPPALPGLIYLRIYCMTTKGLTVGSNVMPGPYVEIAD
jgi:hypothetical protein